MGKKKYYNYLCKECEVDFVVNFKSKRMNCPKCADNVYVEKKASLWLERSFSHKRPWTKEEDELLINSKKAGYRYKDIAETIGRTTKAVNRRASQLRKRGLIT